MGYITEHTNEVSTETRKESVILGVDGEMMEFHYKHLGDVINALQSVISDVDVCRWALDALDEKRRKALDALDEKEKKGSKN